MPGWILYADIYLYKIEADYYAGEVKAKHQYVAGHVLGQSSDARWLCYQWRFSNIVCIL